uniref:Uncharacterized protein n=1 Tax=Zea mays TaxID=4577 RepID=C0PEE5_MAIZE|nr:unknown [Zea mays]
MPIFAMCTLKLLATMIKNIDQIRRRCLWRGSGEAAHGIPLIAWDKVTCPKNEGGLRVLNPRMNVALLMKFVHKFYNRLDIPRVHLVRDSYYSSGRIPHCSPEKGSFWWRDVTQLLPYFRGYAMPRVGDGSTVLLW